MADKTSEGLQNDTTEAENSAHSRHFPIYTTEEMDAITSFVADGAHYRHFEEDLLSAVLLYQNPRLRYTVQVMPPASLLASNISSEERIQATRESVFRLNLDQALVILYIVGLLTRINPETLKPQEKAMVDLDDLGSKAGWQPRSREERLQQRRDMMSFLEVVGRAIVNGRRGIKYFDKARGHEIDTTISTVLWTITGYQQPEQASMFQEMSEAVGVQLTMTTEWLRLLASPDTAQYLPMGEILGSIPGGRNAGAWAKAIGLSYGNFMRRNARGVLSGLTHPSRAELLMRVTPRTGPVKDILEGENPIRAVEYWVQALQILASKGFIENSGEVQRTKADILSSFPKRHWQDEWLRETVALEPGSRMKEALEKIVAGQPIQFQPVAAKRKPGRPRKAVGDTPRRPRGRPSHRSE